MRNDYEEIIIDVGGRDTTSQRAALTIADVLVAPFQPRSLDVWTIGKLASLLDEVKAVNPKLQAYTVVNRADSQGSDNDSALEILRESDSVKCLTTLICQRKTFANAAAEGRGIVELKNQDKKAIAEIKSLCDLIFDTAMVSV
jgi:chromosome partitioning protein